MVSTTNTKARKKEGQGAIKTQTKLQVEPDRLRLAAEGDNRSGRGEREEKIHASYSKKKESHWEEKKAGSGGKKTEPTGKRAVGTSTGEPQRARRRINDATPKKKHASTEEPNPTE